MGAIYLQHEEHGYKVATSVDEAKADKERGWTEIRMKDGKLGETPVEKAIEEGLVGPATAENNIFNPSVVEMHDTTGQSKREIADAAQAEADRLSALADGEDPEKLAKRDAARQNEEHKDDKAPAKRRRRALPEGEKVAEKGKVTIEGGETVDVHVDGGKKAEDDKKD